MSAEITEKAVVRYEVFCRDPECNGPAFEGEFSDRGEASGVAQRHDRNHHQPRLRYVVVENDPGYLPDSEPAEFDNRADAEEYLKDIRRQWIEEQGYNPFEIRGSYKHSYQNGINGRVAEIMEVQ